MQKKVYDAATGNRMQWFLTMGCAFRWTAVSSNQEERGKRLDT